MSDPHLYPVHMFTSLIGALLRKIVDFFFYLEQFDHQKLFSTNFIAVEPLLEHRNWGFHCTLK